MLRHWVITNWWLHLLSFWICSMFLLETIFLLCIASWAMKSLAWQYHSRAYTAVCDIIRRILFPSSLHDQTYTTAVTMVLFRSLTSFCRASAISASLVFPLVSIAPILINLASVMAFPLHTHQVFSQDFQALPSVFPTFPSQTGHP